MILLGLVNIKVSYKCMYMSKLNHACRNCLSKKASLSLQKLTSIINCVFIVNKLCFSQQNSFLDSSSFLIDSPT